MVSDVFAACADQLAASPELVARLRREHVPDEVGLCRAHDAHPERHPCSIRTLADLAADRLSRPSV